MAASNKAAQRPARLTSLRARRRGFRPLVLAAALALGGLLGAAWNDNALLWNTYSHLLPTQNNRVVLVNIDADSIADYGPPHTWTRTMYGKALEELQNAGAKAIGIDIDFSESKPEDIELAPYFSSPQVVLAAPPAAEHPLGAAQKSWTSPRGVSALKSGIGGSVYEYQTGYAVGNNDLMPSFYWQLARAAGYSAPLSTQPQPLLHFFPSIADHSLSFRDVVQGQFLYGDVQDKIVVIGVASDSDGFLAETFGHMGSEGQARAVASLVQGPPTTLPVWLTALLSALLAGGLYILGRQWGFLSAFLMLPLGLLAWHFGLALPTLTFFAVSLVTALLLTLEQSRTERRKTALTGALNNRTALTRALEHLQASGHHNVALALIYLPNYTTLLELSGQEGAEKAIYKVLTNTKALSAVYPNTSGIGFRWGPDELVILVDPVPNQTTALEVEQVLRESSNVVIDGISLQPEVAAACLHDMAEAQALSPNELVDRLRFRLLSQDLSAAPPSDTKPE